MSTNISRPCNERGFYNQQCESPDFKKNCDFGQTGLQIDSSVRLESLLGTSGAMAEVLTQMARVAPTIASVLITGESGTGKEIVATIIHNKSKRRKQPFVVLNCGALSPNLAESELFGHEKGSFTGASSEHRGVFEQADGGTLFLDEVTEMPLDVQVKLLRTLESCRFMRVGGEREQTADVRTIAATNRSAEELADPERLRPDLFYRLQVFPISLPPLRERIEDLPLLAESFLHQLNQAEGNAKTFSKDCIAELQRHSWPGNLRELKNAIQRAYIMADQEIEVGHLPAQLREPGSLNCPKPQTLKIDIGSRLAEAEQQLIYATLESCGGSKAKTASILGISIKTLYNRLHEYNNQSGGA